MAVSILTSHTVAARQSLSDSMNGSAIAGTKMSTGENIIHAYEDPTGLAIGSNLRAQLDVLGVVKTGVEQTQSMLYISEAGMKAIYETLSQMNQILAKSKLGYMTDDLVAKTLSPTYIQLKAEINRIADSVEFNGQKLLNASGGRVTKGTVSTVNTANTQYVFADSSEATLDNFTLTGVEATVNGTPATALDITPSSFEVMGGEISYEGGNAVKITGATIRLENADVDGGGDSCSADIVLRNIDIELSDVSYDPATKTLSTTSTAPTFTVGATSSIGFSNIVPVGTGGITTLSDGDITGLNVLAAAGVSISDVLEEMPLTGGKNSFSSFSFVTGTDLNREKIEVAFPNMRLTTKGGVPGMVSTLNVNNNTSETAPTDLTSLSSVADADIDIPLVAKLLSETIEFLDLIGGYQQRFINIEKQLGTAVEQLDLAQGAIMNADLATQSEVFTRSNVKINIAISVLTQMNQSLEALQNLVR